MPHHSEVIRERDDWTNGPDNRRIFFC